MVVVGVDVVQTNFLFFCTDLDLLQRPTVYDVDNNNNTGHERDLRMAKGSESSCCN